MHIAGKTELNGYVVNAESDQFKLEEMWKIQLSPSEHIIDQVGKKYTKQTCVKMCNLL